MTKPDMRSLASLMVLISGNCSAAICRLTPSLPNSDTDYKACDSYSLIGTGAVSLLQEALSLPSPAFLQRNNDL